jgi:hypothetical protein
MFVIEIAKMAVVSRAELLSAKVRLIFTGKQRVKAPVERGGVGVQAPIHRLRR